MKESNEAVPQQKEEQLNEKVFPAILKRERAIRRWSQADVADKIGSDPKTVGRWERGLTFPSPYLAQRLSEIYEKSVQELGLVPNDRQFFSANETGTNGTEYASTQLVAIQEQPPDSFLPSKWSASHSLPLRKSATRQSLFLRSLLIAFLLLVVVGTSWFLYGAFDTHNPYTGQGTLVLNDSLQANTASNWSGNDNDEGHCFFAGGMYRIRGIKKDYMKVCVAAQTYFTDLTYEVQMQVVTGDCGGLVLRSTFPQLYYFVICQNGNYRFVRYDPSNQSNKRIIVSGVTSTIRRGLNTTNVLAIVAKGDRFTLYVNHRQLYQGTDEAYQDGQIGLIVHTCSITYLTPTPDVCSAPVEAAFSNAKVWKM